MNRILCIVPLYNKIKFLPYSIGSVLNQEDVDVTMVIVDDCSTDGSYEWVQEQLSDYPNVHILRNEENVGCYQTRNRGLKYAIDNGIEFDYYTVTDPDDQQMEGRFKTILQAFKLYPSNCVFKQSYIRTNLDTGEMIKKTDAGEGSAFFKRECFDIAGYWDNTMRFSGDTEYITRLSNYWHKSGIDFTTKVGRIDNFLLYCMCDNTGQNLTMLYPNEHPERQAIFRYIDEFTTHSGVEDVYYGFDNTGNPYAGMGAPSFGN